LISIFEYSEEEPLVVGRKSAGLRRQQLQIVPPAMAGARRKDAGAKPCGRNSAISK
jgi:hypothetical protein